MCRGSMMFGDVFGFAYWTVVLMLLVGASISIGLHLRDWRRRRKDS